MTGAAGAGAGVSVGWLVAGRADALLAWQVGGATLLDCGLDGVNCDRRPYFFMC